MITTSLPQVPRIFWAMAETRYYRRSTEALGLALEVSGNLYIRDSMNNRIVKSVAGRSAVSHRPA